MGLSSAFLREEFTHAKLPLLMDVYLPRPGHNWLWTEITFPARLVSMPLPLESLFGAALTFTEEHIWKLCYCYSSFPPPTRHEILTRNQATNPRTTLFHVLLMPIIKKYKCQWVVWVLYKINIFIRGDKYYTGSPKVGEAAQQGHAQGNFGQNQHDALKCPCRKVLLFYSRAEIPPMQWTAQ